MKTIPIPAFLAFVFLFAASSRPAFAGGRPPPPPQAPHTPWYAALHASETGFDLSQVDQALNEAVDLGFEGIRTDVRWYDVEPVRGQWDTAKLQFFTSYVSKVRWYGLDPLIIFSSAPQWAVDLYNRDPSAFWAEYEEYVAQVILWIGDRVDNYQLWNEANHMIDPIDAADDWQLFSRAGAVVDAFDPSAKTYVNVMANLAGWENAVTDWLDRAGPFIDVVGIDHYPGTWACCSWTDWGPLDTLIQRINTPGTSWYGKEGMVMETGFSSWAALIADEYDQRDWINQSLPVMRAKINDNNVNNPYPIVAGGFYQLVDVCTNIYDSGNCWNDDPIWGQGIEAHFGIIHSNYSNKVGYSALKNQLQQF